ncbi:MAG TPA: hypothetical protein VF883_25100, partial [Thermoanaerobaculia bacterium]
MALRPLLIGVLVLAARLLTFPRTPWDVDELQSPFALLVAISIAASVVTAVAFAYAFQDDVAALLFSFSAAALVHGAAGRLDAAAWMFVALALCVLNAGRGFSPPLPGVGGLKPRPTLFGLFAGAVVACRPEMLFSALTLLFAGLFLVIRDKRERVLAGIAFAIVALPFVIVPEDISGVDGFNLVRFTLHPWGSKFVALPLLIAVAAGIRPLIREWWNPKVEVLMWFAFVHVATGIAAVKPADGVRWAVPSLLFTALLASKGLRTLRVAWVGAVVLCAMSVWYAYPILRDRVTRPSPLVEATRAIPAGTVVLYDRDLDRGLHRQLDDPRPLLHFAEGRAPGARVFSREEGDAYGKLTRNAYREVSLIPIAQRWAPIYGVHSRTGDGWRWVENEAEIALPRDDPHARLELRLPENAPIPFNDVTVNGATVRIARGETRTVKVRGRRIVLRATRAFEYNRDDPRHVAVQLVSVSPAVIPSVSRGTWAGGERDARARRPQ